MVGENYTFQYSKCNYMFICIMLSSIMPNVEIYDIAIFVELTGFETFWFATVILK